MSHIVEHRNQRPPVLISIFSDMPHGSGSQDVLRPGGDPQKSLAWLFFGWDEMSRDWHGSYDISTASETVDSAKRWIAAANAKGITPQVMQQWPPVWQQKYR